MAGTPRRRRADADQHRTRRVNLRLSDAELAAITHAAQHAEQTPAGYAARAAVAAARGELDHGADIEDVRQLAYRLMQTQQAMAQAWQMLDAATAALHTTGTPAWLAEAVQLSTDTWQQAHEAVRAVLAHLNQHRHRARP